jgi:hypothetical protein
MKSINFNLEEVQLIIESLLFTAGTDVCSEHTDAQRIKMVNLAESLNVKFDKPNLHNIYLYKDTPIVPDKITVLLCEKFSNLPQSDIITD